MGATGSRRDGPSFQYSTVPLFHLFHCPLPSTWSPHHATPPHCAGLLGLLLSLTVLGVLARAEGRVSLELVTENRAGLMSQQEWLQRLARAGVTDVRISSAQSAGGGGVGVEVGGTAKSPVYLVTGVITADDVLVLPGGKFRASQAAQAAHWLQNLAEQGPAERRPAATAAFGLEAAQYERLGRDLAKPLGISTSGVSRAQVVQRIAGRLATPIRNSRAAFATTGDDKLTEDLSALSCGTARAALARSAGLSVLPKASSAGVELEIVPFRSNLEAWPVGWKPDRPVTDVLPALYRSLNAKFDGVAVSKVLDAFSERLKIPMLLDHLAMARQGIDPATSYVTVPESRISYRRLLDAALFQARLTSEVRVDDAGKPFLWVTTSKPL